MISKTSNAFPQEGLPPLPSLEEPEENNAPKVSRPRSSKIKSADPKNVLGSGALHPALVRRVERLIEKAQGEGMNLYVVQGYRGLDEQARLLKSGRGVTNARPGNSFHNYGLAVDIVFQDERGRPSWDERHDWRKLGELGKEAGLHWGGDWRSIKDRPHFQLLPNDRIGAARRLTREMGLDRMWGAIR